MSDLPSSNTTTTIGPSTRGQSVESFKVMDVLRRANELESTHGRTVYHCEVGQPESGAPKPVAAAAIAALCGPPTEARMGYTDAFGLVTLRQKICEHYHTKYHLHLMSGDSSSSISSRTSVDRIVVTTGSSGAFLLAFTACFDVDDVVAIASSGYPCYRNILGALGCKIASIPVSESFKLTASELQKEINLRKRRGLSNLKGLIISSPSNPTGAMLCPNELKELCELCDKENIRFISDEIYHGISYGKEEATALMYSSTCIVINSFSKYYSMCGWRLGWMVLPADLIATVNVLQQNMFINAPTISQTAALHCWDDETIYELEGHVMKYKKSREFILQTLDELKKISYFQVSPADGGFYVYIDLGDDNVSIDAGLGSTEMCRRLLEETGVAFTPGTDFEDPENSLGDRRFRISYAGSSNTVTKAMELFVSFWPTWVKLVQDSKL
jgi:aspartate/methionine/tyrosine aminotransferase